MTASFIATRVALHALAKDVLESDLAGAPEPVTLRAAPNGFATPDRLVDGQWRRLRVEGTDLVTQHGDRETRSPIAGIVAEDAERLAQFFRLGDDALHAFRANHVDDDPSIVQIFPHHFDIAISLAEARGGVNVGASPGDADHDEPYLYVGPWEIAPNSLWNESWGVSLPWTDALTVADAVAFFEAGFAAAMG